MTERLLHREPEAAAVDGLFSRTYATATTSYAVVMFLTGFAALAVVPTLPEAADDLDGVGLYPLVAGCFVAASLFGGVLGGAWADRSGARRPLALGVVLAVVTLVVSATSTTIWQLAAGRFLDGVAAGMVAVAINTAIAHTYPDHLRGRALALMSTCWIVPSLAGPPLAGLVSAWWSWRVVFLGLAVLNLLPSLAVVVLLRGQARPTPAPEGARAPRPALLVAAAVSLGAALAQYAVSGWDLRHLTVAVAGFALLTVFAPRLLPQGTGRAARGLPASVLLRGLASGTYFTLEAFVPLLLHTVRDVPPVATGLAFTGAAVAWAASSWVQGHLLARTPRHHLVVAGAALMTVAVATATVGSYPAVPWGVAGSSMVVAALGMGLLAPSLTLLSLGHTPPDRQGHASGAMQTAQNLGQVTVIALGSALFNVLLGAGPRDEVGYAATFGLLLVPSALVAVLATRARAT